MAPNAMTNSYCRRSAISAVLFLSLFNVCGVFCYLLSNGFKSISLNLPIKLSNSPCSPVFSCNIFAPSSAVCWAFLSSFILASFFARCTTSSLSTFCCVLVNCCLSFSENILVMLDGSFDNKLDALFGSAFCNSIFETIVIEAFACYGVIPTRCANWLASSFCACGFDMTG
jgi:hypothetical protein